jgi:anhydro-N-acetylmuramic acid kinase
VKKNTRQKLQIIGLMSGTSLDGLDIACCLFDFKDDFTTFELLHAKTIAYPHTLERPLRLATSLKSDELCLLDKQLGAYFAEQILVFIQEFQLNKSEIAAVASHGHTIFHQPNKGFTLQIGCGSTIALNTGIAVINDFRTKDVLLGGQGAPLVPIGDFDLFSQQADAFLNLGGFSNISLKQKDKIIAFDICPCNLPLNRFAAMNGYTFDKGGMLAKKGSVHKEQLMAWDKLPYYLQEAPKSLGTEWLDENFYAKYHTDLLPEDSLRTCVEHIANQIGSQLEKFSINRVLVTGGGAKNTFLLQQLKRFTQAEIIVPADNLIDFKEALIFAYLGALFLQGKPNNVPSVTGAKTSVCGGVMHLPN